MRKTLLLTATGLALASLAGLAAGRGSELQAGKAGPSSASPALLKPVDKPAGSCGSFGTSVEFVSTPSEAARQARKEQKLVFVLHVSGHFEDPKFT